MCCVLLGYLIEKITGGSDEEFVRENIFTPLGMPRRERCIPQPETC